MAGERFTVAPNHCGCHPETCCCDPWVVLKDGEPHSTFYRRSTADEVAQALNVAAGVKDTPK